MSFRSAFALAQKQEADDHPDDTLSIKHAFNMASTEMNGRIDGSPSPAPRHLRRQSYSAIPQVPFTSRPNGDLGQHLAKFDKNHKLDSDNGPLNGLFGKTRLGPKVSATGNVLAKKASDSSLGSSPVRRRDSQREASPKKKNEDIAADLAVGPVDRESAGISAPIPSIEYESASDDRASPVSKSVHPSPEKSHNWQIDADFTAGDLQVSDSPRIRTQSNGRTPRRSPGAMNSPASGIRNGNGNGNNRIDQIRQKEIEAANAVLPEEDPFLSRRSSSRIEEVRAREMEALSRRAVATSRLDEIRVRNSEARPESPETGRGSNREDLRGSSLEIGNELTKTPENKTESEVKGEQLSDTVLRDTSDQKPSEISNEERDSSRTGEKKDVPLPRNTSRDLLRRLERATSNSPSPEKIEQPNVSNISPPKGVSESREVSRSRLAREEKRRSKNLEVKSSRERPTVGFAGLQRDLSSDSVREKRASLHGSEADPTDRIEAEMKLFAPLDNYSEKGSVRAPSPLPSEPDEEETPRPNKIDPLTQPTPRVTGAYIETPATVKVKQEPNPDRKPTPDDTSRDLDVTELRSRSSSKSINKDSVKSEEEDDVTASSRRSIPRSSSEPIASRRTRSASRRRRPLRSLINTARPPSVKDDIRAILRMNQIDDSTLEEFDSILADQQVDDETLQEMVNDTIDKIDDDLEFPGLSERDRELQVFERMGKTIRTGLLGIRSAKKGIERLEDQVTHTEHKTDQARASQDASSLKSSERVPANPNDSGIYMIPVPALYRKTPKFRLTKFGLLALAMSIWYVIESIFCALYVIEYHCTPNIPCEWSPNEPYFPYVIPFMLDEWTTEGKGRELIWWAGEEIGDAFAEVADWVTNTDFTQYSERYMNAWQRNRHRRRLRKHGLIPKWVPPPGYTPKYAEWNAARLAREAAAEAGHEVEDETMSADERIQ